MADQSNVTLFTKLYSKLADALSVGTPTAMPGQNYLTLCNPGIILDPKLDLTKVNDQAILSSILNDIPQPNWVYATTGGSAANVYDDVLEGKELAIHELTEAQQKQLKSAEEYLITPDFAPTRQSSEYLKYEAKYYEALTEYQTARATSANTGKPMPQDAQAKLDRARREWSMFGFKTQVETAQATVKNLRQLDPNRWWERLQNQYENASVEGPEGKFQPTTTYPSYQTFMGNTGWTSFTFTAADLEHQVTSSAVSAGGGVSASWGLWRVSASADYSKSTSQSSSNALGMTVSMEMMRASIRRPWLDPLVFRARTWRFSGGGPFSGQHVATGTFTPGQMTPDMLMPLFPTGVLVARKVSITGAFTHEDQTRIAEAAGGTASVGWGPFAISGRYNQSNSSDMSLASTTSTSMANANPQILGFFCDVLPLCPNPDSTLKWPS